MLVMSCQANPYQRLILLPDLRTDRPEREDGLQTWHEVFGPRDANPAVLRTTLEQSLTLEVLVRVLARKPDLIPA